MWRAPRSRHRWKPPSTFRQKKVRGAPRLRHRWKPPSTFRQKKVWQRSPRSRHRWKPPSTFRQKKMSQRTPQSRHHRRSRSAFGQSSCKKNIDGQQIAQVRVVLVVGVKASSSLPVRRALGCDGWFRDPAASERAGPVRRLQRWPSQAQSKGDSGHSFGGSPVGRPTSG